MDYPIKLNRPGVNDFHSLDEQIKNDFEKINSFEERLDFYNNNIKSLAHHLLDGQIYVRNGESRSERIRLYCACTTCKRQGNFYPIEEPIFLFKREKEVNRIVDKINSLPFYKDKLEFYYQIKGSSLAYDPIIYSNIPILNNNYNEVHNQNPVIDLRPSTTEEKTQFSIFIRKEFELKYTHNGKFNEKYNGFDFIKEREKLLKILKQAVHPQLTVRAIISKIENYFDFSAHSPKQPLNYLPGYLSDRDLFYRMCLGLEVPIEKMYLKEHDILTYTHVSEIIKFYKFLFELLNKSDYNFAEISELENDKKRIVFDANEYKLDLRNGLIPLNICRYYIDFNEFIYINYGDVENIPILRLVFDLNEFNLKENSQLKGQYSQALLNYALGFLMGIKDDFIPKIDTPENRKELILKSIFDANMRASFPVSRSESKECFFDEKSCYERGFKAGKNYKAWSLLLETPRFFEAEFPKYTLKLASPHIEKNQSSLKKTPRFKQEKTSLIVQAFKIYFSDEDLEGLKRALNGKSVGVGKLIFRGNGSQLADAFKQLKEGQVIYDCEKKELELWISENFSYQYRGKIKDFKLKYLNDIISTTKDKCKKPILDVRKGDIIVP